MLCDSDGFAIPFAAAAVIECGATDPAYGEPESWPPWTDAVRFEPSPADSAWLAANPLPPIAVGGHTGPTDADWDEYRLISEWQYCIEQMSGVDGDDDLRACGLPVG